MLSSISSSSKSPATGSKAAAVPCVRSQDKKSQLEYIAQLTQELRSLAEPLDEPMVVYLFEMAYVEVFDLINGRVNGSPSQDEAAFQLDLEAERKAGSSPMGRQA